MVAQFPRSGGQPSAVGDALAECLQGRQALDAVEKLRAEGLQRPLTPVARAALALREGARRDQGHDREDQHDRRNRHVPEGNKDEDRQRRQHRDADLRDILPEKSLELLDPIDNREHHPAGALAGKPCRAQYGDLVIEPAAQILLHPGRGAVRDHRAVVVDKTAQNHCDCDPERRNHHGNQTAPLKHP